jgi:putative lipoprotein
VQVWHEPIIHKECRVQRPHRLLVIATASLLTLVGCTSSKGPVELGHRSDMLDAGLSHTPTPFMLSGMVSVSPETASFTPCGSQKQYWLNLSHEQRTALDQLGGPVYGEFEGFFTPVESRGFSADYPASVTMTRINLVTTELNSCAQPRHAVLADGQSPRMWSAAVGEHNMAWESEGDSQEVPLTGKQMDDTTAHFRARNAALTLTATGCQQSDTTLYGWRATLKTPQRTYQGCALLPSSTYHPQGETVTKETGVWQPVGENQVQVLTTRSGEQMVVSERIYTRNGFTLTATEETFNGNTYSLGHDGLTLKLKVGDAVNVSNQTGVKGSAEKNPRVEQALRDYLRDNGQAGPLTYRWLTHDLNQDGQPELLVLTDSCGSGGCTLLVFKGDAQGWQFNSRMTLVHVPLLLARSQSQGWHDLVVPVGGGGAPAGHHVMRFDGQRYPLNPSTAPRAPKPDGSDTALFADGIYATQQGVVLGEE